jgi:metal-dependent hydrolase (beta-lactamase superfamily II)
MAVIYIAVTVGQDGLLIIDTGHKRSALKTDSVISTISNLPVKYVLNTHLHFDHVGGNNLYRNNWFSGTRSKTTILLLIKLLMNLYIQNKRHDDGCTLGARVYKPELASELLFFVPLKKVKL